MILNATLCSWWFEPEAGHIVIRNSRKEITWSVIMTFWVDQQHGLERPTAAVATMVEEMIGSDHHQYRRKRNSSSSSKWHSKRNDYFGGSMEQVAMVVCEAIMICQNFYLTDVRKNLRTTIEKGGRPLTFKCKSSQLSTFLGESSTYLISNSRLPFRPVCNNQWWWHLFSWLLCGIFSEEKCRTPAFFLTSGLLWNSNSITTSKKNSNGHRSDTKCRDL